MERPESATKMPEAGRRISPARYCTSTLRPRKAEKRAILYVVSVRGRNRVNSTEGPPSEDCGKAGPSKVKAGCALGVLADAVRHGDFSRGVFRRCPVSSFHRGRISPGEPRRASAKSLTFCGDGLLSAFRGLDSWPN